MVEITASRTRISVFVLGTVGIIALTGGSLFLALYQTVVRFFLQTQLVLKPGYDFFQIWKEIPLPVFQKVYMFNITNPESFSQRGNKPIVEELGPYVFKGNWRKEDLEWDDEAGTITYQDVKTYTFVPELSSGTLEDKIYTLNGPLLAVINHVDDLAPYLLRPFVVQIMNGIFEAYNESLLVHKTIREMLYEGYHEPMVEDLTKMVEPFMDLPVKLINNTFGILYEKRILGDGVFTIESGVQNIDRFAKISKWNNHSHTDWWGDQYCDKINGTDGVQFPPEIEREQQLFFFNPNLCRSLALAYEKDITVHGISTFRFAVLPNALSSPAINPENTCYCAGHKCYVSGIIPYKCKKGAPYVLSHPHFFEADPELQTSLIGVSPSADKHKTYFDIEPITGFVLNAAVRMQLNGVVKQNSDYLPLKNVGESIVPVMWLSEEATLDVYFANYYKRKAQMPLTVFKAVCIASIALGALWTVSAVLFIFCIKGKVKPLTTKNSLMMKSLQSMYTSVALWPPTEEEAKELNQSLKTAL